MAGYKIYSALKQIAYELQPCQVPTKAECVTTARSLRTNIASLIGAAVEAATYLYRAVCASYTHQRALRIAAWLSCWAFFAYLEFGAVFLIITGIGLMFANLDERKPGDAWSAYSVFNAGCRAILGTLDARQLERQLLHQNPHGHDDDSDHNGHNSYSDGGDDDFVMVQAPRAGRKIKKGKKGRREIELRRQRRAEAAAAAANAAANNNNNNHDNDQNEYDDTANDAAIAAGLDLDDFTDEDGQ